MLASGACSRQPEQRRLGLGADTVQLPSGAEVVEVRLGGPDSAAQVHPESIVARPGDVIRFVAVDARTHAIAFEASALAPAARAFLRRTDQMRGPPLISVGAAWVVSLEGAPGGRYPFICLGDSCRGVVTVSPAGGH